MTELEKQIADLTERFKNLQSTPEDQMTKGFHEAYAIAMSLVRNVIFLQTENEALKQLKNDYEEITKKAIFEAVDRTTNLAQNKFKQIAEEAFGEGSKMFESKLEIALDVLAKFASEGNSEALEALNKILAE